MSVDPPFAPPLTTTPEVLPPPPDSDLPVTIYPDGVAPVPDYAAAKVLVEHLFARGNRTIGGVDYAVGYQLAHGLTGGDIVDVYHFDNDAISFSIADISGKGTEAAVHAAMVKYGLRAYASHGLTPESVLRALDRLYLENNAFERTESFASVFFGMVDVSRRIMTYASGGHEPAALLLPGEPIRLLAPTAPLIGVFDDQHHLFKQSFCELPPGALFVATTDGVTEARAPDRSFFGVERFLALVEECANEPVTTLVESIISRARTFSDGNLRDDVAVLATRFL
ncbi:MAG: serine/threonine-protein phosphatase [Candidatus Eremiobacteraeota bacterium]|nr:serine/threonine-protein phosphatase [Candidatus Eremiobacteraeota bacterium]